MTNLSYDCNSCKKRYPGQPEKLKALFKQKSCDTISSNPTLKYRGKHAMTGAYDIVYHKCPANYQDNASRRLISLFEGYEKGYMPYTGGTLEQPAKFVELMDLVHNLKNEYQMIKEDQEKKYKRYGK